MLLSASSGISRSVLANDMTPSSNSSASSKQEYVVSPEVAFAEEKSRRENTKEKRLFIVANSMPFRR